MTEIKTFYSIFDENGDAVFSSDDIRDCEERLREFSEDHPDHEEYIDVDVEKTISEFAWDNDLTPYHSGGFKKLNKTLKAAGWDFEFIDHEQNYMGWGVACTVYTGTTPDGTEFYDVVVNWG